MARMPLGFYILVLLMAGTGLATAIIAKLNKIVFQASDDPTAAELRDLPDLRGTFLYCDDLVGFIVLHVLAPFYHHFVRKDGLFRRMFFGQGLSNSSAGQAHEFDEGQQVLASPSNPK
jgi:cytochrome b561